jgi:hypothetical protein
MPVLPLASPHDGEAAAARRHRGLPGVRPVKETPLTADQAKQLTNVLSDPAIKRYVEQTLGRKLAKPFAVIIITAIILSAVVSASLAVAITLALAR